MTLRNKNKLGIFGSSIVGLVLVFSSYIAYAQSSSTNYRIEESYFGTGGEIDASSTNYRSRQSAGSLGVGNSSSTNYDAVAGFTTPTEIFLEIVVTGADVDFGVLSPSTTAYAASQGGSCNCSFYVRSHLSSGYVVTSMSDPPKYGTVTFSPKTTLGIPSSSSDVEEFGMNLVANTSPGSFGAGPINVRQEGANEVQDNTFADGRIDDDYDNANQFKWPSLGNSDIIAYSPATTGNQGVGKTNYTISYIMKPSNLTAAGKFTLQHDIVATATF